MSATGLPRRAAARLYSGDADGRTPSLFVLGACAVVLVVLIALPNLLPPFYVGTATIILVFALWALGLNVLAGSTGLISLGHAAPLGVAAYTMGIVQGRWDWSFWTAALVALALTLVVSFVFSLMVIRGSDIIFLMITLAQGMIIWGLAHRWTAVTGGDNGLRGAQRPDVLTPYWNYYWFTLITVIVVAVALRWFLTSTAGLRLRGVKDSPTRMASLGYSVTLQRLIAFNLAGLVAGIAGVLHAGYFQFISPSTVFLRQSVEGVLMILVGGVGAFLGPVIGAAGIIAARTGLTTVTDRWTMIMGALLILTVLYAPNGLVGHAPAFARRLRRLPGGLRRGAGTPSTSDESDTARPPSPVG